MNEAEYNPTVMATEAETPENIVTPETVTNSAEVSDESSESARRALAMLSLDTAAADGASDFSQERVDAVQAKIEDQFAPKVEEKPATDLVGAIESATEEARTSELSNAAALAAEEQAYERAKLMELKAADDDAGSRGWPQERLDTVKEQIESKYAKQ